ncbi:MAG: sugar phosphate isomerase/epimerase family protein [Spirochaetota bacterium]
MNYSFMSFSAPTLSFKDLCAAAKEYGYDGIEPRAGAGHAHGVELTADADARRTIRMMSENTGIAVSCIAISSSYSDPADTKEQIETTREYIDLASDIGCGRIRVFGGQLKGDLVRSTGIEHLASALQELAPHAERRRVRICVETHDGWCDPAHLAEVMRRVDDEWVSVNWDIMHPVRTRAASITESFDLLKPWIQHLHIHDCSEYGEKIRFVPVGTGIIDHRAALHLIEGHNRDIFMSFELIDCGTPASHLPHGIAAMKEYESAMTVKERN